MNRSGVAVLSAVLAFSALLAATPAKAQTSLPTGSTPSIVPPGYPAPALIYFSSYVAKDTDNQKFDGGQYKHFLKQGSHDTASMIAYEGALSSLDGRNSEKAMKQNVKDAINYLGMVDDFSAVLDPGYVGYRFLGQGSPPVAANAAIAEKWLLQGAKGNDSDSTYNLGVAYLRGDLLQKDEEKGLAWC